MKITTNQIVSIGLMAWLAVAGSVLWSVPVHAQDSAPADSTEANSPSDDLGQTESLETGPLEAVSPEVVAEQLQKQVSRDRKYMLIASLTIFVLAIFIGFEVIAKVPPTLHTPLMSGSNAISGITIVGALIVAGDGSGIASFLGFLAVILATINAVGGFLVTHRMLAMFKKR